MSEHLAKATRRDIRRAVGVEAVSVLDNHGQVLAQHLFRLNQHGQQLHEVQKRVESMTDKRLRDAERVDAFISMTFVQRVRWFLGW